MAYLIPAPGSRQLQKAAVGLDARIGVFAAANLLKLGHVSGVPPHLYVRHLLPASPDASWAGLVPVSPSEPAQIILKQPAAPESLFRAAVRVDNVLVSDVLQSGWMPRCNPPGAPSRQTFCDTECWRLCWENRIERSRGIYEPGERAFPLAAPVGIRERLGAAAVPPAPRARALEYEPLATLDTDVAFGRQEQLEGSPPLAPAQT
jgi:hypothetical protein